MLFSFNSVFISSCNNFRFPFSYSHDTFPLIPRSPLANLSVDFAWTYGQIITLFVQISKYNPFYSHFYFTLYSAFSSLKRQLSHAGILLLFFKYYVCVISLSNSWCCQHTYISLFYFFYFIDTKRVVLLHFFAHPIIFSISFYYMFSPLPYILPSASHLHWIFQIKKNLFLQYKIKLIVLTEWLKRTNWMSRKVPWKKINSCKQD